MGKKPLQPGTKIAYVAQHFSLPNDALIERAKADGVEIDRKALDRLRFVLRSKHGYPYDAKSKSKSKSSKAGWASRSKSKAMPKHTPKARAKAKSQSKHTNGVSPARAIKHAEVRKLIFEMGWDDVREIFLEFQEMHERFGGG
jgi:hypothetical protein